MNYKFRKILLALILVSLIIPLTTKAVELKNPLIVDSFQELVEVLINVVFTLALAIAPIMYIIAGFFYLTSAGDPKKIETAKKIIIYTTVGLIIVVSAKGIMAAFNQIFLKQ